MQIEVPIITIAKKAKKNQAVPLKWWLDSVTPTTENPMQPIARIKNKVINLL